MLSERFDLMFPRSWHSGETSRFVSQFLFRILDSQFFSLYVTYFFLCQFLFVPVCSCSHFSSVRNVFSLLATVTCREYFREQRNRLELISFQPLEYIWWHHSGDDGKHAAVLTRWSCAEHNGVHRRTQKWFSVRLILIWSHIKPLDGKIRVKSMSDLPLIFFMSLCLTLRGCAVETLQLSTQIKRKCQRFVI